MDAHRGRPEDGPGKIPRMSWSAYVDESEPDPRFGAGVYVLAAALVEQQDQLTVQEAMTGLRLKGQRKLHWRDEDTGRRKLLAETVAELPALHLIVVKIDQHASSERRRRLCLVKLLAELDAHGVSEIYLEAREAKQNDGDRGMLDALRAQKMIGSGLRMYHHRGPENPLLWVPDIVAGAVGADRAGEPAYLNSLAALTTLFEL